MRPYWYLIEGLICVNVALSFWRISDVALYYTHIYGNVPYGIVWTWVNPFWWRQTAYTYSNLIIQMAITIPMLYLVKIGKLNKWAMAALLLSTAFYRYIDVYQEITPMVLMPLATINPLFELSFFIQRFPFWSLSWADPHFLCAAFARCYPSSVDSQLYDVRNPAATFYHLTFLYWVLGPLYAWVRKRHNPLWDADRFWLRMIMVLAMIIAVTLYVYYVYPWSIPGPWDNDNSWRSA